MALEKSVFGSVEIKINILLFWFILPTITVENRSEVARNVTITRASFFSRKDSDNAKN